MMQMTTEWGDIPAMIERALLEYGPMTGGEIAQLIPVPPDFVQKALRRMREPSRRRLPIGKRRVHVTAWTHDAEGERRFPRAIYALGHGSDAPRPPRMTRAAIVAQQRRRKIGRTRMNYVFNLGAPT